MNDLSIIIVNLNNKQLLKDCLYSIYQQTKKISFEVIVIDNASTDGSVEMVKLSFPEAQVAANQENVGFAKANNQALALANARYALLLNNDTVVKDGAFDKLVEFMDNHPRAGACGPRLLNPEGTIQRQGSWLSRRFWLAKKPVTVDFVVGACLLVRKEVVDQVGYLDENLFFYNEDLDWCLTIRKAGYKIYFLPEAEVIHFGGASSRRAFNPQLLVEGFKGGLYFCRKHYGEFAYQSYRLLLILGLCLSLPLQLFNHQKLFAYWRIIGLAAIGQIARPMIK